MRQVQQAVGTALALQCENGTLAKNSSRHVQRELILARTDRCMRGENALLSYGRDVVGGDRPLAGRTCLFLQEFDREQTGMSLVHVEPLERVVAERAEHPHTADAENHLLAQPVAVVAAIEKMGERAIEVRIRRDVRVQQVHGHDALGSLNDVPPAAKLYRSPFDEDRDVRRLLDEEILHRPVDGILGLSAGRIEALAKVALAVE